ncbi:uncharacterized protein LOC107842825 [Capsicum annuum]|uniref:uncharacterized protein LOC107842825 n=1 Tax=Capsicum annuum TaxID=4072 RepID=UPI0007BF526A|nr:uncharacterized protein LOC107842825 [Capsicum annuum]XP_047252706.1 uncharacterized protein LOC107842825 [Capsicum annuum]
MDIILDGPHIPVKEVKEGEITRMVVKRRRDYDDEDRKKIENNYKSKKLLVCGIEIDEYNRISTCENAKEISNCLRTTYEGTTDMKDSKVDMLTTQCETFTMKEGETIQEIHTRFTFITNELHCLGEVISLYKQVRKILGVLPKSYESKVDSITEARNLKALTMDKLIGNLNTYELKKQQELEKKEVKREKCLGLKASKYDSSEDDIHAAYLENRIVRSMKKNGQIQRKGSSSKKGNNVKACHKCGSPENFIKNCPMHKLDYQEHLKTRSDKGKNRGLVLENSRRKVAVDYAVKQALTT